MAKQLIPILGKNVKFILNEPRKKIKGGVKRESTLVSRKKYNKISQRENLNNILLNHCSDKNINELLKPEYEPILHKICLETITTGNDPIIRKKAIWALRNYFSRESINLLTDLAVNGEDEYVRSSALSSIGSFGINISAHMLVEALKDKTDLVKNSARKGLESIRVDPVGKILIKAELNKERNVKNKKILEGIIEGSAQKSKKSLKRQKHSSKD